MQSMLNAAGADAGRIAWLWWFFIAISIIVFVLVIGFLAYGLLVRRDVTEEGERTKVRVVAGSAGATVVVLIAILFASVAVGRSTVLGPDDALTIEVIGHQWWWEVRYLDPSPHRVVVTANEVHLPVGERIRFLLSSRDVIHSFWIPPLGGKIDMFPDRVNTLWLEPTKTGVFRGQCTEFCGMQHGKMAFMVVVHEPADFAAWLERERAPAAEPADELAERGRAVFMEGTCATCHRVRGTEALATLGPDLTHIGSRRTLAAGTMPNDRARMAAWLVDPQRIKPGSLMPPTHLEPEALQAVLHYLEQLR
jgi:cytochrome c oxidase subunit II